MLFDNSFNDNNLDDEKQAIILWCWLILKSNVKQKF